MPQVQAFFHYYYVFLEVVLIDKLHKEVQEVIFFSCTDKEEKINSFRKSGSSLLNKSSHYSNLNEKDVPTQFKMTGLLDDDKEGA